MDADYNYDSEEEVDYSKMDMVRNHSVKFIIRKEDIPWETKPEFPQKLRHGSQFEVE